LTGNWIPLADAASRTVFEWGRIQSNSDWILPLILSAVIVLFVRAMYRRDAVELGAGLRWLLTGLRLAAFLGLLVLFLQPQWRSQREVTRNSKALVLIDTSSSMGVIDADPATGEMQGTSRAAQVADAIGGSDLLDRLRQVHDVTVLRFDEKLNAIVSLDKDFVNSAGVSSPPAAPGGIDPGEQSSQLPTPHSPLPTPMLDWSKTLAPTGTETRLGDALRELVYEERGSPISGVVVFSDGGQNAGASIEAAIEAADEAKIPIFPVGVGSDRQPSNVRIYKIEALPRAYPGDPYTVTALVQVQGSGGPVEGMTGKSAGVELLLRKADGSGGSPGSGTLVDRREILLGDGGETLPVKFEITPEETGRQTLCVRVVPPRADHNPDDDFREADVEVVDRRDRVLLFAGGPTREYRFLRTQLFRDASMTVDVLLQTAEPGMSQEADALLDDFPATREEMFAYDCLVAFDPDWRKLASDQIALLEQWVGEQGGGMIAVAGAVYAGEAVTGWVQDSAMESIRALYPVEFQRRGSLLSGGSRAGKEPWPLDFTREGLEADYLWLDDTAASSLRAWAEFAGVYSYCPVRGPKAAATVLARFSDPRARQGDEAPVYLAEQFYGSGRVFYLGSGEMWRLRQVEPGHFERFYTRLIRHVSQGRLLRQSSRGALMVGQDSYSLGKTVEIRAQLTDAQLAPLETPQVTLDVFPPDGSVQQVVLRPGSGRAGTYSGQFTVLQEGTYRLELPVPESTDERITRRIQVTMPDLERQDPRRNDKLLARIADGTGGKYFDSIAAALGSLEPLVSRLRDRTKTVILTAAPDPAWEEAWLRWLMIGICGALCLEWLIRRIYKLA
jgi:hypothetical protein